MANSAVYRDLLLKQGHGLPLWKPDPNAFLPEAYTRHGISIGDLGLLTDDGGFDYLFNIHADVHDPVNQHLGTPPSFIPLPLNITMDVNMTTFQHSKNACITRNASFEIKSTLGAGVQIAPATNVNFAVDFTITEDRAAMLVLPHGADRYEAKAYNKYKTYVVDHAESWYQYVNWIQQRGARNGSLYLVTGCDKACSWGLAAGFPYQERQVGFSIASGPIASGTVGFHATWHNTSGVESRHYPQSTMDIAEDKNQCVFTRGIIIAINENFFKKKWAGTVRTEQIASSSRSFPVQGNGVPFLSPPGKSVSFNESGRGNLLDSEQETTDCDHDNDNTAGIIVSNYPEYPKPVLSPGSYICEYLLSSRPDIDIVMVHDNEWIAATSGDGENIFTLDGTDYERLTARVLDQCEVQVSQGGAGTLTGKAEEQHHPLNATADMTKRSSASSAVELPLSDNANIPIWFDTRPETSYSHHYERTKELRDIDHVLSHDQRSDEYTLFGNGDLSNRLTGLGHSYLNPLEHAKDVQDIEHVISHHQHQRTTGPTPSGHADLPSLLTERHENINWAEPNHEKLGEDKVSYLSAQQETTRETSDISSILSPSLIRASTKEQGGTAVFKDISFEFSSPDQLADELTLVIMHGDNSETLRLAKTSPTMWKADENIEFDNGAGDILLIIHSKNGGDEAFLTLTADEIYTMVCVEEDTPVMRVYASMNEDSFVGVKMTSTVVSNSTFGSGAANIEKLQTNLLTWQSVGTFQRHFQKTGNVDDITQIISYCEKAISSVSPGLDIIPGMFNILGNSYLRRFEHTGDFRDVDCAISHHEKAVESTLSSHADHPRWFSNLASSYSRRFEHTGNLQDIDYAISHQQRAVDSTPADHADLSSQFNNLGTFYSLRFERTGNLQDIDYAISYHQKAVASTLSGHADLSNWFSNLGRSYSHRFERTGDLQDIDCVISHHHTSVDSTPSGHSDLPGRFNNLGCSYLRRFECTGNLQDIDYAISYHQRGVESTPSGHTVLPSLFNNLGSSYSRRFECTGDLQDIDCAIFHHQRGVESTPSGHADLPSLFNNLGSSYLHRFEHIGDIQDIDYAISHHQKAVESTPSGHADISSFYNRLGNSYIHRFKSTNHFLDVQNSILSYRRSSESNGKPSIRLKSAKMAAMHSSVYDRPQCLVDFALAISFLSEVAGLEQTIHRRYANLHSHSDLLRSAVTTALDLNRPDLALEWLEQGRCLVWNQLNQLRTPIDDLRMSNPFLADRFTEAASALESYGSRSISSSSSSLATLADDIRLQNDTRNHTVHAAQYRQLLEQIRSIPEFHDFLRPPQATNILDSLPSNGPVIVFNLHKDRCDALALIAGIKEPLHIRLEDFSLEQAEQLQQTLRSDLLKHRDLEDQDRLPRLVRHNPSSMLFILKELWCKVVQPILAALGYFSQLNPSDRRRIWWCPTGPLAFLPLHAAGIYDSQYGPGFCISDYAVSSYTPTVQSLKDRKSSAPSCIPQCTNLLLISPNTPNLPAIPFAQTEIHNLKALVGKSTLLLEDASATTDNVKRELNTHSWVHFACHGIQDITDPLKSGVHLHDGRLELLEIMRQKLSSPDLAFLSACQTSKGDVKLSEEVVHLAAGMLAAGYRGVVGTMWSISDLHSPLFAKHFYEYLLEGEGSVGLDSTRAAYALDYATRKVRESLGEGDAAFLTWVPYVHFGY